MVIVVTLVFTFATLSSMLETLGMTHVDGMSPPAPVVRVGRET